MTKPLNKVAFFMSFRQNTYYKPNYFLFNRHLETIYPALFRKINIPEFQRERLELADGDFIDIDWLKNGNDKCVILNHGLEGNSTRPYMLGMAKAFSRNQFDILSWNFRGCSGEINRLERFYHSGETTDMDNIVQYAKKKYSSLLLVGFSLGANIILKYLGEQGSELPSQIKGACVFSVPIHLESSCNELMKVENFLYERRFLRHLLEKVEIKSRNFPELFDMPRLRKIKKILEFDDLVTAPLHGFKNAHDYYSKCSSLNYLSNINIPTLLVNASNDPMLSGECFPEEQLKQHAYVHFEKWKRGGHVGFFDKDNYYASERRAISFCNEIMNFSSASEINET